MLQGTDSIRNPRCKLCDLCASAKTVCIMGSGSNEAKLMLIGEAPGEDEDNQGKVFVGKAGKMLDSILVNLNIDRKKLYITNVIKCHPLFNNKPNPDKLDTCSSAYLRQEIELINPDLIVCLGGIPAKALLRDWNLKVTNVRDTVHYTQGPLPQGIPFIVTYHPAATFHQPELLEFIINDLEWAKRLLNGELPKPKKKVRYKKAGSIAEIPGIEQAKWIELDLETDGLDPFLPDKNILSLQISIKPGSAYYFDWSEKIGEELKGFLETSEIKVNGHNIKFDLKWLRTKAGIIFRGRLNDTIQNIHLIDENYPSKSLDTLAGSFTELKGHKDKFVRLINQYIKLHKDKKEPITKARARLWGKAYKAIHIKTRIEYGCGDADATGRLRIVFRPKLKELGLIPLHKLMMNSTKMYTEIECNGMKIDTQLVDDLKDDYEKKLAVLQIKLDELSPVSDMNHGAPVQVKDLLYRKWKCYPHEIRQGKKRIKYTTAKDALELILKDDIEENVREYITHLLKFRDTTTLYTRYLIGMPRYLRDGYVHAEWNLVGTETGRTACKNPPLQQIPREGDIKRLFISRYKDGVIMSIDVSQGELRMAAQESDETELIRLFNEGGTDIHRAVASNIYHKRQEDIGEIERFNAKTINFLILYGGGIKTLAQEMKQPEDIARKLLRRWHGNFPGWRSHVARVEEAIVKLGYVRNLFGRYRHLFIIDPESPEGMAALRAAVNSPIQGDLSDYNKLCGTNAWVRIKRGMNPIWKETPPLFIGETHDNWLLDIHKGQVPYVAKILKEEFEHVNTSEFGFQFKVPMKVDIKFGPNWKEMEDYEYR